MFSDFWLCFVPLFVAVDAIGLLPVYLGLTEGLSRWERRRVAVQSTATALGVAVVFLFLGQWILRLLGITIGDFMVAGGALLFVIALSDLLSTAKEPRHGDPTTVGAVPLGVPLTVGPAVLTTILLLANQYGQQSTVLALASNLLLTGVMFWFAEGIDCFLGRNGTRTFSKIMALVVAAIAVKMIRLGMIELIAAWRAA